MKPLRIRLDEYRKQKKVIWEIVEKDYLLSWVLEGIAHHQLLSSALIFKGGTALRKCYFDDYRFSEDLDFSMLAEGSSMSLASAIKESCALAEEKMNQFAPFRLTAAKYEEKQPHPAGQKAFEVRAQFPWHREPLCKIMIEITRGEPIVCETQMRSIAHPYGEELKGHMLSYSLEEIVLEKLRAILQQTKKLHEGDFKRSRVRDYYDLWYILKAQQQELNGSGGFIAKLQRKCAKAKVSFNSAADFFDPILVSHAEKTWVQWLKPLVPNLPLSTTVISELRAALQELM